MSYGIPGLFKSPHIFSVASHSLFTFVKTVLVTMPGPGRNLADK
jgi:hypothetical protein